MRDLDQLPGFSNPSRGSIRANREPIAFDPQDRRGFLRIALSGVVGVGLATLGILPPMRSARASHAGSYGYRIRPLPCPTEPSGTSYDQTNTNCAGCCCSRICSDCCYNNSANHKHGWHKETSPYSLRPSDCTQSGNVDGWQWDYSSCCGCFHHNKWRCHDGHKLDSQGIPRATICMWTLQATFGCGCA